MARKKPAAKKASKKAKAKPAARKMAKKAVKKSPASAKKATAGKAKKAAPKAKKKAVAKAKPAARKAAPKKAPVSAKKKPNLDRPRKTVAELHGAPSSLNAPQAASSAGSGRLGARQKLREHTSSSPAMTAGDVDADWESADSTGDEAPGGDNPTPDQDVVDEIGRALGVEYEDDEELQGGAEITERDAHRWELDPSSKDDFEDE